MILRGVDACPGGWISVSLPLDGGQPAAKVFANAEQLFNESDVTLTAVDIPIGLPARRPRVCDEQARKLLGPRKSSVFPAPIRAALDATTYERACAISTLACGKKLSKQTYGILPKIRDVDAILRRPGAPPVFEVHPEVSFYFWNNLAPMRHPKRTGFGFAERLRLVEDRFGNAADAVRDEIDRKAAADDDILDAFAALWTAVRIQASVAAKVAPVEERDDCGLAMQIWA